MKYLPVLLSLIGLSGCTGSSCENVEKDYLKDGEVSVHSVSSKETGRVYALGFNSGCKRVNYKDYLTHRYIEIDINGGAFGDCSSNFIKEVEDLVALVNRYKVQVECQIYVPNGDIFYPSKLDPGLFEPCHRSNNVEEVRSCIESYVEEGWKVECK